MLKKVKLAKSIEYLVDKFQPIKGLTRIMLIIYFADRWWKRKFGETYTEVEYVRANHGVYPKGFHETLSYLDGIEIVERPDPSGWRNVDNCMYYSGYRHYSRLRDVELSPRFVKVLAQLGHKWTNKSLEELVEAMYKTSEVENNDFGDVIL